MSMALTTLEATVFESQLGFFGAVMREGTVLRISIGQRSEKAARLSLSRSLAEEDHDVVPAGHESKPLRTLKSSLVRYAAGERVDFSRFEIDLARLTPYQRRVVEVVRSIPRGETLSYSQVAERSGSPNAARAVGNTMANNRFPILVPCHRVLTSTGQLGGFSAPGGVAFKQRLLDLESAGN
jgi:methylated-DNA-[protein]-cysteine S-methyltransferase